MTAWKKKNITSYYIKNRSSFNELYLSETKLLTKLKNKKINKILDFGCATGNLYKVFKKMFKNIEYTGIDIEKEMIKNAVKIFKKDNKVKFILSKKKKLPFKNNYFDFTFCTSVLHHVKEYKKIIEELTRVSSKYIFIDSPRVHFKNDIVGSMNLDKRFDTKKIKKNNVDYYVVNLKKYLIFIKKLIKKYKIKKAYFFCNKLPYSKEYMSFKNEIFYMTVLLIKSNKQDNFKKFIFTQNKKIKNFFSGV